MAEPKIKPDPEAAGASPAPLDDDIYEDAGDLEFFTNPAYSRLYLARVPNFVWDAWSSFDEDAEIQIGTMRVQTVKDPAGEPKVKLSMLLNSNVAQHQMLPKEYNLDITEEHSQNTFIFTEQNLPGYKSKSDGKFDLATANIPSKLLRPKNDKVIQKQPYDPNKKFQPYFKKLIPKRTTLAGTVAHELNCVAVQTKETQEIMSLRTLDAMKPKSRTQFVDAKTTIAGGRYLHAGTVGASAALDKFIKINRAATGHKAQQQKAARMPQNELLDSIFACFRRYKYWSMKSFRAELKQPEAYLRETLEKIAVLAKSGKFATHWSLKPENQVEMYASVDEVAPTVPGGLDGVDDSDVADLDGDDDDEDIKFEDVVT